MNEKENKMDRIVTALAILIVFCVFAFGGKLYEDGVDDYSVVGHVTNYTGLDTIGEAGFTISVWIKWHTAEANETAVCKWKSDTNCSFIYSANNGVDFNPWIGSWDSTSCSYEWTNNPELDRWYHLVWVRYFGVDTRQYVNGEYKGSDTDENSTDWTCTSNMGLGCQYDDDGDGTETNFANVSLTEVCIFNKALSETEIKNLYARREIGQTDNKLIHFIFDEDNGVISNRNIGSENVRITHEEGGVLYSDDMPPILMQPIYPGQ
jgi:hypothetical protein